MSRAKRNERSTLPVSRNSPAPKDRTIPAHLRTEPMDALHLGIRKGKCRNKVGMWGNLSPYFSNSVTIDARWSQTVSNHG